MNESHSLLSNSLEKYQVEPNHSEQDLFEHLSMELKEITALYNAGVALNSSLDPKQVILALYKEASRLMDTSNFALVIYDEVKHNLNFLLVFDKGQKINPFSVKQSEAGLTSYVISTQSPVIVRDIAESGKKF